MFGVQVQAQHEGHRHLWHARDQVLPEEVGSPGTAVTPGDSDATPFAKIKFKSN